VGSTHRSRFLASSVGVRTIAFGLSVLLSGCQLVNSGGAGTDTPTPAPEPAIERGSASAAAEAAAAGVLSDARKALADRNYAGALAGATRVVDEFATVGGSSEALWIQAQAATALEDWGRAAEAAVRYQRLLRAGDPRGANALMVEARALLQSEGPSEAVRTLLAAPPERVDFVGNEADALVREIVRDVSTTDLKSIITAVPNEHPLLPPVLLEYGIGSHFAGDLDVAGEMAQRVLASDANNRDREVARSLMSGAIEETLGGALSVGLMVPRSGSPTLQEYAMYVEEGVAVALQMEAEQRRRPVRLQSVDDGENERAAAQGVARLEELNAIAIVGPLLDRGLAEAVGARQGDTPILSPTASAIPGGAAAVYSLAGPDAGAAEALASYASDQGFRRLALVHSADPETAFEAQAFLDAYAQRGRGQVQSFSYQPGQTTFSGVLLDAESFGPDALVLAVPDRDIELLAPQVTFHGFDTLGVSVLATSAWAESENLSLVDTRHTDGVVVASPRNPDPGDDPYAEFEQAYETVHRKSLRSPIPAFGFDAARLILDAIERGARSPSELTRNLEETRDFRGATGRISIVNGRVTRRHMLYEVQDRQLIPVSRAVRP